MFCNCPTPAGVYNGVCGACLLPLTGTTHDEGGKLIKYRKPKIKKQRVDNTKLKHVIFELERFGRLNGEDVPLVLAHLRKTLPR